jgi:hypothetical protein
LVKNVPKVEMQKKPKKQEKPGENFEKQLLVPGDFSSGEKPKNQDSPGQIRRFGNPGHTVSLMGIIPSL